MRLLAFDTSSAMCSAALLDGEIIIEKTVITARKHAHSLLPMCEQLLSDAGFGLDSIDAIAFGRGPGSFTGLRIAASMAQGLAFSQDIPVVPVSSLQALAQGAHRLHDAEKVLVAMDARMHEVYWCSYRWDGHRMQALSPECVIAPQDVPAVEGSAWFAVGAGWQSYRDQMMVKFESKIATTQSEMEPSAYDIAELAAQLYREGAVVSAEQALPVYLRNQVTHGGKNG